MSKDALNAEFLEAVVGSELLSEESKAVLTDKVNQLTEAIRQDVKIDMAGRYVADRERLVESVELYVEEITTSEFAELRESLDGSPEPVTSSKLNQLIDVVLDCVESHLQSPLNVSALVSEVEDKLQGIGLTADDLSEIDITNKGSNANTIRRAMKWALSHHTDLAKVVAELVDADDNDEGALDAVLQRIGLDDAQNTIEKTPVGRFIEGVFLDIVMHGILDHSTRAGYEPTPSAPTDKYGVSESLVSTIDGFINECVAFEFSELAQDLKEQRRSAPDVIGNAETLIESLVSVEMAELKDDVSENHRLASALALAESKIASLSNRNEQLAEAVATFERQAIMERVLRPLDGATRAKMEIVLADTLTEEIEATYAANIDKVIGNVVDSGNTKKLTEGKSRPSLTTRYFGEGDGKETLTEGTKTDDLPEWVQRQIALAGVGSK